MLSYQRTFFSETEELTAEMFSQLIVSDAVNQTIATLRQLKEQAATIEAAGVEEEQPKHLSDIIDLLMEEPEYRQAARLNDPPRILVGNKDARCGKVIAKMTGGTSAPDGIYEELKNAGVGTVVAMHMPKSSVEECRKHHLNVVISGHMASDSLGINQICDEWERHGIEVFGAGGFTRFSRN